MILNQSVICNQFIRGVLLVILGLFQYKVSVTLRVNKTNVEIIRMQQCMQGGSLLGKGSYGCVFRPPLLCKPKDEQKNPYRITGEISKVSLKKDATRELEMGKKVKEIGLWQNYFLPVVDNCDVAKKQTEEDIDECDIIDEVPLNKLTLLSLTYGGESLVQVDLGRMKDSNMYWSFGKHLLEGVFLLTINGIVHRDLHRGNVLIDRYNVARIIDFGISVKYNDDMKKLEKEMIHEYDPDYTQEPPEYNWWALKSAEGKIEHLLNHKQSAINARSILGVTLKEQIESSTTFLHNSKSFGAKDFAGFWSKYWSKYDAWSVGGILVAILKQILIGPNGKVVERGANLKPVSYTHLTLPTILRV